MLTVDSDVDDLVFCCCDSLHLVTLDFSEYIPYCRFRVLPSLRMYFVEKAALDQN